MTWGVPQQSGYLENCFSRGQTRPSDQLPIRPPIANNASRWYEWQYLGHVPARAKDIPILSPISESFLAWTASVGVSKPMTVRILELDGDWNSLPSQAPPKNPYTAAKRTTPIAFFTAKKQKIRIVQHMLHITIVFITPYLFTIKFGTIRPTALPPLRIVNYISEWEDYT